MNTYESLAEQILLSMEHHRHMPPEQVSDAIRGEMAVLLLLDQEETGLHSGAIADSLHMTTSRIAAILNSLEKKEMILRKGDSADKRRVLVFLTEKGEQTCKQRRSKVKSHLTALLSHLSIEDAATFVRIANQLFTVPCTALPDKEA